MWTLGDSEKVDEKGCSMLPFVSCEGLGVVERG